MGLAVATVAVLVLPASFFSFGPAGSLVSERSLTVRAAPAAAVLSSGSASASELSTGHSMVDSAGTNTSIDYGLTNLTLPAWNNLSGYAWNCNSNVSTSVADTCFTATGPHLGYAGTQVPLLSWTADGAFYVNASFELVFYSFVDHTVSPIAPWLPLYDAVMYYTGVTNTEFITSDGSYIYEFGCLEPACLMNSSWPVTSYAVNVSTGRTFEHQWGAEIRTGTSSPGYSPYWNSQMNMVGVQGNDSLMTLAVTWTPGGAALTNGTIWAYDIWTGSEWKLTDLPFFEANNLYWIPEFQEFFDVSAENTQFDAVAQVTLSGAPVQPVARLWGQFVYVRPVYGIGGVGGLWVNVSSRQVAFSTDWQGHNEEFAVVAQLNSTGVVNGFPRVSGPFPIGTEPAPSSGEHRSTLVTGGPAFVTSPSKQPSTWLADPRTNSTWWPTNVSQSFAAWNLDGSLFYNTSYSILTTSDQCNRVGSHGTDCALEGSAPGTVPGTITWAWQLGVPEFPFLPTAPRAEPYAPGPWTVVAYGGPGSVELAWTPPAGAADPPVNFTLYWGPASGVETGHAALPASASGYLIGGLAADASITYRLDVWNLHWRTTMNGTVQTLSLDAPPSPKVSVAGVTVGSGVNTATASVLVTLLEPRAAIGPLVNDTLRWGYSPLATSWSASARDDHLPVGSGSISWVILGLALNTSYYFAGVSWNAWGESLPSKAVAVHTPAEIPGCPSSCGGSNRSTGTLWPIVIPALVIVGGVILLAVGSTVAARRASREADRPN